MKHLPAFALLITAVLAPHVSTGQAIATTGTERDTRRQSYWRLSYDNDFFTATDKYFTQGIALEIVSPRLRALPTRRVMIVPRATDVRYGIGYEDDGYTASDLKAPQILQDDHPYAGTKQLRVFAIADDTVRRQRVTSLLTLGIIGQGAGGKEIQTFIHRHTGNTIPQGWGNQIRNDVILNYEAGIERQLFRAGDHLLLTGSGSARAGTFNTATTVGLTVMAGRLGSPFAAARPRREFYLYAKPQANLVGQDATLQGGLLNRSSPYTISASALSRIVYRQQVGIVYRSRHHFIEYYQSLGTREFRGGRAHRSGGFQLGFMREP